MTNEYLSAGLDAIQKYSLENLTNATEEAIEEQQGNLHFEDTAENFRQKAQELGLVLAGKPEEVRKFLNNNPYIRNALEVMDDYVQDHKLEINQALQESSESHGLDLVRLGVNPVLYSLFSGATKANGLFGEGSGLSVLVDHLMNNLGTVASEVSENWGEEVIGGQTINQWGLIASQQLGISLDGLTDAYAKAGLTGENGTLRYLTDNIINNGAGLLQIPLMMLQMKGINHGITAEDITASYTKGQLIGKGGVLAELAKGAVRGIEGSDKYIYAATLYMAREEKITEEKKEAKKAAGREPRKKIQLGMLTLQGKGARDEDEIDKQIQAKNWREISQFVAENGIPESFSQTNLTEVCNANGILGENGLIDYLLGQDTEVFRPAIEAGIVEEADITRLNKKHEKLRKATSWKDLKSEEGENSERSKYAIALAREAEALSTTPLEVLKDPQHIDAKRRAIEEGYGSVDALFDHVEKIEGEALPVVEEALRKVQEEDFNQGRIERFVDEHRPEEGFFRDTYDLVVERVMSETLHQRIEDYLVLSKALLEKAAADGKERRKQLMPLEVVIE